MTQAEKVYNYIKANGEITPMDAVRLGIYRLAAVVFVMKKAGIPIKTERRKVKCWDGSTAVIGVYSFDDSEDAKSE